MADVIGSWSKGNLLFMIAPTGETDARIRVDLKHGYISYSMQDKQKALDIFASEGIRLRICKDIYDEGVVILGEPLPKE